MDEFDVPLPCQFSITDEEEEAATAGNAVKKSKERERVGVQGGRKYRSVYRLRDPRAIAWTKVRQINCQSSVPSCKTWH